MILELLNEKKHFLIEFNKFNSVGISNFQNNNYDKIDSFYNGRENLLEILKYIEEKIENQNNIKNDSTGNYSLGFQDEKMIAFVKLEIKAITHEILNQDLKILSLIENEKSSIIKELQNINKNKKNFGSYKTKINQHQIDEEA